MTARRVWLVLALVCLAVGATLGGYYAFYPDEEFCRALPPEERESCR